MENTNHSKARILIVDDESAVANLLSSILSDRYDCITAGSAEEALTCVENGRFDLVISDINMCGMSGIELISRIGALCPNTVMMMISGNQDIDSPIDAIRRGAFDYIKKPFEIEQVELAVDRAITHAELLLSKQRHEGHLEQLVEERSAKLHHLAYHDVLTGLNNRAFFEELLVKRVSGDRPHDNHLSVLFVSLDRFEGLRDTLGHSAADRILKEVADRLGKTAGATASAIARLEGDEFAILADVATPEELMPFAAGILEAIAFPVVLDEYEFVISASIGISRFPKDGTDAQTLFKNAGAALSHARKEGGNNYQFYTSQVHETALRQLNLENELRHALERRELELYYQPKIDTNAGKIVGMEALIRWNHAELGTVPPSDFIPLAEETGLIVPIGQWILRSAFSQTKIWHDQGYDLNIAVNLSSRQFKQKDLAKTISQIVVETGVNPHQVDLEVTETAIMDNPESAIAVLAELRATGIQVAIDDFGTGYSSLGYLKHLPADILKIDKSFVDDVTNDPDDAALVMAVITLAHNMRLKVVAEGVETDDQLRFLRLLRCDQWQGYLYSKPVPASKFEELL